MEKLNSVASFCVKKIVIRELKTNKEIINNKSSENNFAINFTHALKVDNVHPSYEIKLENGK